MWSCKHPDDSLGYSETLSVLRITAAGIEPAGETLGAADRRPAIEAGVAGRRSGRPAVGPVRRFRRPAAARSATARLEGAMFLSAWLKRRNLQQLLELNLGGNPAYLDGFVPQGRNYLAAKPHGLAAMWMAGNVATLPMFSLVPGLLAKNVCLMKLALPDPAAWTSCWPCWPSRRCDGLAGAELLEAAAVVWFDYHDQAFNEQMSLAADARVAWGGDEAMAAISRLPRREHCVEILFGPKYSIGLIGRKQTGRRRGLGVGRRRLRPRHRDFRPAGLLGPADDLRRAQPPPLAPRDLAEMFARHLAKLPPKPDLDAFTTVQIMNVRAEWALDDARDVIASADGELDRLHGPRAVVERGRPIADDLSHRDRLVAGVGSPAEPEGADRRPGPGRRATSRWPSPRRPPAPAWPAASAPAS